MESECGRRSSAEVVHRRPGGQLLGYGETKVRMLIIAGDLRSLKDGRSRRVLPEWVDDYVPMRAAQARRGWYS